jgi:hypothetical protein
LCLRQGHTEPRISFHETAAADGFGTFVVSWPGKFGRANLATFNGNTGAYVDGKQLDRFSTYPMELACDQHLTGANDTCSVYIQAADQRIGLLETVSITIPTNRTFVDADNNGLIDTGPIVSIGAAGALLVDVATYGENADAQVPGNRWHLNVEGLSTASRMVVSTFTDAGMVNLISGSAVSQNPPNSQANVTSWDYNESIRRFVAVRTGAL